MRIKNPYRVSEKEAWNWFKNNIAYKPLNTQTEMVLLKGKWNNKKAIKIPIYLDNKNYRTWLSQELNINITNYLFNCRYSRFGEEVFYRAYIYTDMVN